MKSSAIKALGTEVSFMAIFSVHLQEIFMDQVARQESTKHFLHVEKQRKYAFKIQANMRFITKFPGNKSKMKNSKDYHSLIWCKARHQQLWTKTIKYNDSSIFLANQLCYNIQFLDFKSFHVLCLFTFLHHPSSISNILLQTATKPSSPSLSGIWSPLLLSSYYFIHVLC